MAIGGWVGQQKEKADKKVKESAGNIGGDVAKDFVSKSLQQEELHDKISKGDWQGAAEHAASGGGTGSFLSKTWKDVTGQGGGGGGGGVPTVQTPEQIASQLQPLPTSVAAPTIKQYQAGEGPKAGQIKFDPKKQKINMKQQEEFRKGQMQLMAQLQQQAAGQGPSLAGGQLSQGIEASIAAQQAALASARGGVNPALARQAMQTGAEMRGQEAMQAAQLRMQEQLNAQQALGTLAGQGRQQDIGLATEQAQLGQEHQALQAQLAAQQAGMTTQANIAGYQGQTQAGIAGMQAQAQADIAAAAQGAQMQQVAAQLYQQALQGDQAAMLQYQQLVQSGALAQAQMDAQAAQAKQQMIGGLLQTAGTVVGGIYGGPAGAAAGGAAGGMLANQMGPKEGDQYNPSGGPAGAAVAGGPPTQGGVMGPTQGGTIGPHTGPPTQGGQLGAGTLSDERAKNKVKDGKDKLRKFLEASKGYEYEYRDKKNGRGKHVSPMAQNLEKTALGKTMVEERPDGLKQVNYGKGFGTMLAALSDIHTRLKKVEKK